MTKNTDKFSLCQAKRYGAKVFLRRLALLSLWVLCLLLLLLKLCPLIFFMIFPFSTAVKEG